MANRFQTRLQRWARRRQGPDSGSVELTERRIYIVPTRPGLIFGLVLFSMLLGAINYSNNMGFTLVFILTSIAIVSIHHCQRNLAGLRVSVGGGRPVFAGEPIACEVRLANPGRSHRWQVLAGPDAGGTARADIGPGESAVLALTLATNRRGRLACPEIRISTQYPLGFFRAWSWLYPDLELLVYPQPSARSEMRHTTSAADEVADGEATRGADEFVGLRTFEPGELPSRIAWNALARTGELLAKDYRSGAGTCWLDWDSLPGRAQEERLSILTRMVLDAQATGRPFGLRLPGLEIQPGAGSEQLHHCLRALTLFEPDSAPPEAHHGA